MSFGAAESQKADWREAGSTIDVRWFVRQSTGAPQHLLHGCLFFRIQRPPNIIKLTPL